jgi:glutamyl-tRNA reductase
MQRLLLLGLNHATAPLGVREKVAFAGDGRDRAVEAMRAKFPDAEITLLSTCNRVELYAARAVHGHPRAEEIVEFLAAFHGIRPEEFAQHLYQKSDRDVVAHLFTVASSLDSMVLGETQILGQVREAYDAARGLGATGTLLNPLFQRALAVGKEVMSATSIAEGRVSVASVAVDYARRIFDSFSDKCVLSIGAGEMASLVLQSFAQLAPRRMIVTNRSPDKAVELAAQFGGEALPFEGLNDHLVAADVVVSSTGATHPIITASQIAALRKARRYRPMFLIDIALPRDVEAAAGEIEQVFLYNIDDLQSIVEENLSRRAAEVERAESIVNEEVTKFMAWQRSRSAVPTIVALRQRFEAIRVSELQRLESKLGALPPEARARVDDVTRLIVEKLLLEPTEQLKGLPDEETQAAYTEAINRLFKLQDEEPLDYARGKRLDPSKRP